MSEVLSEKDLADIEQEVKVNTICPARFGAYIIALLVSHKALQRRVEWTTERPTKEGWYWFRKNDDDRLSIFEVYSYDGKWLVRSGGYVFLVSEFNGEWAFIPPPHEARG